MKIRFMGLICHVHRDKAGKDIAVLMNEAKHHARLRLRKGYVFGEHPNEPEILCEDLAGCTVTFDLGTGDARNHTALAAVPRLTDRGADGATLHSDVGNRITSGNLRGFIELPAGAYGVEDFFEFEGTAGCIARTVTYDVDIPAGRTKVTVEGLPGDNVIELKPDAQIYITNLEPIQNSTSHFPEYGKLFDPAATITNVEQLTTKCANGKNQYYYPTCSKEPFKNVGVECSNTTYP